jgi:hypothetical protein
VNLAIETGAIYGISATQISGDALDPQCGDVLALQGLLNRGEPVPKGWRVLSGNAHTSTVAAVILRYEAPAMKESTHG